MTPSPLRVLVFSLGAGRFGVPSHAVRAVVPSPRVTAVPRARPEVLGLLAWHGRVIPVVAPGGASGEVQAAVVGYGRGGWIALAADRVEGFSEDVSGVAVLDPDALVPAEG